MFLKKYVFCLSTCPIAILCIRSSVWPDTVYIDRCPPPAHLPLYSRPGPRLRAPGCNTAWRILCALSRGGAATPTPVYPVLNSFWRLMFFCVFRICSATMLKQLVSFREEDVWKPSFPLPKAGASRFSLPPWSNWHPSFSLPNVHHHSFTTNFPPKFHHQISTTNFSPPNFHHQIFTTKCSPPNFHHQIFTIKCPPSFFTIKFSPSSFFVTIIWIRRWKFQPLGVKNAVEKYVKKIVKQTRARLARKKRTIRHVIFSCIFSPALPVVVDRHMCT